MTLAALALLAGHAVASPAASPTPPATPPSLVDVTTVAPGVVLEMRYAISDNFLHQAVYPCARCLLRPESAAALAKAETALEGQGYRLKLWDCYRPPSVQRAMWKIEPDARFVADPKKGSVHGKGGAVDVTVVTADGAALEMPTKHDDFTDKAAADAPASPAATKDRAILRKAMEDAGFAHIPTEWWHFDYAGSKSWPILDADLCTAGGGAKTTGTNGR